MNNTSTVYKRLHLDRRIDIKINVHCLKNDIRKSELIQEVLVEGMKRVGIISDDEYDVLRDALFGKDDEELNKNKKTQ